MKLGVSLPDDLVEFADAEAARRGVSRSGLLAELLDAERVRQRVATYIDQHGWDVVDDEKGWRSYQASRFAEEYGDDDW